MKNLKSKLLALALYVGLSAIAPHSVAEDIDVFTGASGGSAINANVLIILDNTSNWSAAKQHWPEDGGKQGISELKAIKTVVETLGSNVNLGLMMLTPTGSGNPGGYIRSAIVPMTEQNKDLLEDKLESIIDNFQSADNKAASNANYGNALFDAFKYLGGFTNPVNARKDIAGSPTGKTHFGTAVFNDLTPTALADQRAYTSTAFTAYAPPETLTNFCARNYIIFIGNGFPNEDNRTWLANVNGDTTEIAMQNYQTTTTTSTANLGLTNTCYSGLNRCATTDYPTCSDGTYSSCSCTTPTSANLCSGNSLKYTVQGVSTVTTVTPISGSYSLPSGATARTADEWARYLHDTDVSSVAGQQNVATFTIDVYKDAPSADQTRLLRSMANVGGGKYYAATSRNAIILAIKEILAEIQAVNTTFASTSLPVNATNRTQNENQVFIGMFRPDADARPRWFGNLKRYQLINTNGTVELGDAAMPILRSTR